MATKTDLVKKIEKTRSKIGCEIDEVTTLINTKLDLTQNIRKHPARLLLLAAAAGLSVALISSKGGRKLFFNILKPVSVLGSAYFSKKAAHIIKKKLATNLKNS